MFAPGKLRAQTAGISTVAQNQVAADTALTDANLVQNIRVKTQSAVRTQIDVVSTNPVGSIVLQEAKSSATAGLTPNQAAAHPEIAQTGATVVGKGKPRMLAGRRSHQRYVRNNPFKNTDPTGRDCQNGLGACLNYIWGGVKAMINTVPNAATAVSRVIDPAIAWTGFQFGAAPTFHPANRDQAEGMEAANGMMMVAPFVSELGAVNATTAAGEVPLITRNAAQGRAFHVQVVRPQCPGGPGCPQ